MRIYVWSDLHLGHKNIIKFRNQFDTVEEHDALILKNWRETIQPGDKIYLLGDVAFNNKSLELLKDLPGTKYLVMGNHDILKTKKYDEVFKRVMGSIEIGKYDLTHKPIHPDHLRDKINVHGHLHGKLVRKGKVLKDKRYINVCCEHTNYRPVLLMEL